MSNQKPFWCWRSKFWKFEIQSADWLTPFSYRVDNKWLTILTPVTCFIPFQSSNWNFRSVSGPEVTGNELFLPSKWLSDLFFEKSGIWYSTSIIDARGNATGGYPHIVSFNFYGFLEISRRIRASDSEEDQSDCSFWNSTWESGRWRDNFKSNNFRFDNF